MSQRSNPKVRHLWNDSEMTSKSRFHFCHGGPVEFHFPRGCKMAARFPTVTTMSYRKRERLPLPEVSPEKLSPGCLLRIISRTGSQVHC